MQLRKSIGSLVIPPDIIVFTETHLSIDFSSQELGLSGYTVFRRDRYNTSNHPSGGGVLIAIKSKSFVNATFVEVDNILCKMLFVNLKIKSSDQDYNVNNNLLIGSVYFPPLSNSECYKEYISALEFLSLRYSSHELLLFGDFNLPKVLWINNDDYTDALQTYTFGNDVKIKENSNLLRNYISFLNCKQFFPIHPNKQYTLDLLFSNVNELNLNHIPSRDY